MIVRKYGRRNRAGIPRGAGGYSDSLNDGVPDDLPFAPSSQDFFPDFPFSSQESSSLFPSSSSFDPDPFGFDDLSQSDAAAGGQRKAKKPRNGRFERTIPSTYSTTLMEAQEFGEMMEHVDEVNFALDGLRKGQPVRIRRASLLSLLSICGTSQQRRLLRTQGMAKTILDAMLGLSFDDSSSNLAAAALFYVLSIDGLDDHLLESPSCILFLIRLLKPVVSTATEGKARSIGSKLLLLHKDSDLLRDTSKLVDSSAAAIVAKVQEILITCKDLKSHGIHDGGKQRPELSPKWIALLAMEKSCLSKISFEDTSGPIRKAGSNFKEKLRELGGLDAVFEVAMNCHSVMERWRECGSPPVQDGKNDSGLQSLMLLLKCLKIMENATFLSEDNQSHLLGMKGKLDSHGTRLSFPKLLISVVEILSGFCLLKCSSVTSVDGKSRGVSDEINKTKDSSDIICISSTNSHSTFSGKSISVSQSSTAWLSLSASTSGTASTFMNGACQLRTGIDSSMSSSCTQGLTSSNSRTHVSSNGLQTKCGFAERSRCPTDVIELLEDDQDPYAFDEDDFQPSKWDLLSGKKRRSRTRNIAINSKEVEDRCQHQLMTQQESSNSESCLQKASDAEQYHLLESSEQNAIDEEFSSLIADCHLTAIKVLMNLTNDNPVGCQQIAASGGLETMSSLIARHFPSFSSSPSLLVGSKEDKSSIELGPQKDSHLTDQELDFLVAILGLLVNLVEKDGRNRSRLAAASVSLPSSEGLEEESHKDVIPLLCSVFLAHQGAGDTGGAIVSWDDEAAMLQGEKEAEKTIVEAYSALLLAFLSTESKSIRDSIANCLPNQSLAILAPVLERFVAFHLTLNMISPETHKAVNEVIESCRIP